MQRKKIDISEEKYRLLVTQMQQGLAVYEVVFDESGNAVDYRFISVNESYEKITGLAQKDIIGKTVLEVLPNTEKYWIEMLSRVAITGEPCLFENYTVELDKYFSVSAFSPKKNQVAVVVTDITEKKKTQEEVEFLSYHDQLTGLYNRRFYEQEILKLDKKENDPIAIIMADVNGLKLTNDAFGHNVGDVLLKKIAKILSAESRSKDIVARTGGDEFILLLPKTDEKTTKGIIEKINLAVANEKMENIILSVSIGYAVKHDESYNINDVFMKAEDDMYRHKLSESSSMRSKTIDLILNSLYEKNDKEMQHSKRVSELCKAIASKMEFTKDDINKIGIAGLMHDIGKIAISENILKNPKRLNHMDRDEVKRHSEIGYRILSSVNEFSEIADYVLEHHERWDGEGYPKGLAGEQIGMEARIIALADTYDAMTSDRPYRKALSHEQTISELIACAGTQFDPAITKIFVEEVLGGNFTAKAEEKACGA